MANSPATDAIAKATSPKGPLALEEQALLQDLCKNDLKFLATCVLDTPDWDTIHDDMENMVEAPSRRKLILVPRGHLKSHVVTKAYSLQLLLRNPNIRILIAHEVWDKSREILSEIKQNLTDKSVLPLIFGDFKTDNRWNTDEIVIKQRTKALSAPSIGTTGVESEMTSTHYDVIICDDLQGLQNSHTPEQREKVKRFYQSLLDLLEPGGLLIVIGTRWHQDDLYAYIIENEASYFDIMVRKVIENGKCIFPKKFNLRFNAEKKNWEQSKDLCFDYINYLRKGKWDFSAQYMNDPVDEENQLFKRTYFKYWNKKPEFLTICMTCDPAISEKQEADYTAIVVTGMDSYGNIYVLDRIRGHWAPKDTIDNLFLTYLKWRPHYIGLETVGFQRTLKYSLEDEQRRRRIYFPIEEVKQATNITKEFRIKSLEPYYRNGNVFHPEWMKDGDLEDEFKAFPRGRNDDMIDAMSMALNFLSPANEVHKQETPYGSWEWARIEAHKRTKARDFFHHG